MEVDSDLEEVKEERKEKKLKRDRSGSKKQIKRNESPDQINNAKS